MGLRCNDGGITLTGGITTASGNTQAVSVLPVLPLAFSDASQPNPNWYQWKENRTGTTEPPDSTYALSSATQQFVNDAAIKYVRFTPAVIPSGNESSPNTGDSNMLGLWIGMMLLACAGALTSAVFSRRKWQ